MAASAPGAAATGTDSGTADGSGPTGSVIASTVERPPTRRLASLWYFLLASIGRLRARGPPGDECFGIFDLRFISGAALPSNSATGTLLRRPPSRFL